MVDTAPLRMPISNEGVHLTTRSRNERLNRGAPLIASFLALVVGCAMALSSAASAEVSVVQRLEPIGTPKPEESEGAMKSAAENAIADLAVRLGIEASAVTVVSVESVTWSDGSIGCPEPGRAYPQVITPG